MGSQTDPAKLRSQHAKQMASDTAAGTAPATATKPVLEVAIRAVAETLRDAGTDPGTGGAHQVNFLSRSVGLNEFRRMVEAMQWQMIIPMFCQPI